MASLMVLDYSLLGPHSAFLAIRGPHVYPFEERRTVKKKKKDGDGIQNCKNAFLGMWRPPTCEPHTYPSREVGPGQLDQCRLRGQL